MTSRGKAVARLSPVKVARTPEALEVEAVARLDALPWIRPGDGGQVRGSDNPIKLEPGEKTLAEMVSDAWAYSTVR